MNISYIATSQIPSIKANSIQVMKVCQALVQNGETVHLFVPGTRTVDWDVLKSTYGIAEQFPVTWLPSQPIWKHLDFTLNSLGKARRAGVDVVYTRMLWVAWAAQWYGIPVILEMHDSPSGRMGPLLYKNYLGSRRRKLVVYITRALKTLIDERTGVQAKRGEWVIAPDGVDLARYAETPKPADARRLLAYPEKPTAVYSGGFYQGRGLDSLLDLAGSFPDVQFIWVGGSAEQVEFWYRKIETVGVSNVILTGFIANEKLPLYQAAADILLMPYDKAFGGSGGGNIAAVSSPMKLFEYMAVGRAILASDIPVLREVLNESNAAFYKAEDFEDLKRQFSALLEDNAKRDGLAQKALVDVKAYEWKTRMRQIMQVYKS